MNYRIFFPAMLAAFLCGVSACATEFAGRENYLRRIVQIDDEMYYPDPLRLGEHDLLMATTLAEAIAALQQAVPLDAGQIDMADASQSCDFSSPMRWASDFNECRRLICFGLPERSRDADCGYLIRVQDWAEKKWLGGLCRLQADRRESTLLRWFESRGLTDCYQASEVVMAGFYRSSVGLSVSEAELVEAMK